MLTTEAMQELAQPHCAELLNALHHVSDEPTASQLERLRKTWPAQVVAAAVEVQWARTKARDKFGARAATLWADREGVQMASTSAAAAWKARRFAGTRSVVDLCCGIGGDLMELSRVAPATGVDLNPARAWMAEQNAGVAARCADALAHGSAAPLVHADPGRRRAGRRLLNAQELEPPLHSLLSACAPAQGVAVKLGPGMDLEPHHLHAQDELEFLCEHGTLTQQVLWRGELAVHPGHRTATHVERALSMSGPAGDTPCSHDERWLQMIAVPCPSVERARLVHLIAGHAQEPAPGLGILTADTIAASPWLERHVVVAQMPAREQTVARWLREHGGGTPVVRTRGKACDPNAWQSALRGAGDATHTVWILRTGSARVALITALATH